MPSLKKNQRRVRVLTSTVLTFQKDTTQEEMDKVAKSAEGTLEDYLADYSEGIMFSDDMPKCLWSDEDIQYAKERKEENGA